MSKVRIALVGIGDCASSRVQGIHYDRDTGHAGLMHEKIGGYRPEDVEVVAAFDVDPRKVGKDVSQAVFAEPNCTAVFCSDLPETGTIVRMGRVLDGVSDHMREHPEHRAFRIADVPEPDRREVVAVLEDAGVDVLVNYLPVGSEQGTRFYAECALEAGTAFVNNIPVFIASDPVWARRFADRGLPLIGDDIKAQLGATIVHRVLTDLFRKRGVELDRT